MNFETVTLNDLNKISTLRPEGWQDITPDFEFYIKSPFCYPIKFQINNKILAVGTSIIFENTAWIAHIIVENNSRKQGIGSAIVSYLLESLQKESIQTCSLIATDLGKPIYLKAGFREVAEYSSFHRIKPWKNFTEANNLIPFEEQYRDQVYELDKKISGENRQNIISTYLHRAILCLENQKVLGYYLPGLREGSIYAETQESGFELMKYKYTTIDKASLPSNNLPAINFLKHNGFSLSDHKSTRMVFGNDLCWQPENIYSRIGGNLG